ncbi:MAG: ethylbenzene dehydrogenase-related protein [Syntrophobacteria bacterium]
MSRGVLISLTSVLVLVVGGALVGSDQSAWSDHELIITATHVKEAPTGLDDPVWGKAPAVLIPMHGRESLDGKKETAFTKVVYTDDSIYFLFKWNDPTRSVTNRLWKFDGEKWVHQEGNEDRITLLFEISRINKFATKGCVVVCHGPGYAPKKEWTFATKTAAEAGDLWDWRAARSGPCKCAVDGWLTVAGYQGEFAHGNKTGRRIDGGSAGGFKKQAQDKSKPLYIQDPAKEPSAPGCLLMKEAAKITDYANFKAGEEIPYVCPLFAGSSFDVRAVSRYAHGGWTVMLYRKLDTGHDSDVVFNPMKHYSFAMALFDDSVDDYSKAEALSLRFSR